MAERDDFMDCVGTESVSELNFTFEGDYDVNALSLARAIENLVALSTATASHSCPEAEVRLSVRAVKPGSLEILFMIATAAAQTLFSPAGVEYASDLASTITSLFEIKRFLRGKKPNQIETLDDRIIIERPDGTKITTPKSSGVYFFDQSIDNSITNIIENASISPGVSGIRIGSHGRSVKIERHEFEECAVPVEISEDGKKKVTYTRRDVLFVRKPDLMGDSQWGFRTDRNIMADMADKDFLEKVFSREISVFSGMHLVADLEITTELGDDGIPNGPTCHYSVKHVHSWGGPEDLQQIEL